MSSCQNRALFPPILVLIWNFTPFFSGYLFLDFFLSSLLAFFSLAGSLSLVGCGAVSFGAGSFAGSPADSFAGFSADGSFSLVGVDSYSFASSLPCSLSSLSLSLSDFFPPFEDLFLADFLLG